MAKPSRGKASKAGKPSASAKKSDDRFSSLRFNPKFSQADEDLTKVKVDGRFSAMFEDEDFSAGGSGAKVDKYGRKKKKKDQAKGAELKKFYKLQEENQIAADDDDDRDSETAAQPKKGKQTKKKSEKDEKQEQEDERLDYLNRLARGEVSDNSSSEDESDDDAASSDEENALTEKIDMEQAQDEEGQEEEVPTGDESRRLAVQNCDWSNVTAQDLFAVMNSFVPTVGSIESITIYPSQYGQKMMALEERNGPMLLDDPEQVSMDENSEHDDDDDESNDDDGALKAHNGFEMAEEGEGYDTEKLRAYELNKLKYYFAVVVCDSEETASVLYRECDGVEFERSSIVLDLRFIPDDVDVSQQPIHDKATRVAADYKPVDFVSKALQSSAVDLTWDDEETRERQDLRGWGQQAPGKHMKNGGGDMVTERDLERFIGSEDEESDGEEVDREAARAKYRKLLAGVLVGEDEEESKVGADDDEEKLNFEDEESDSSEDDEQDEAAAALENSLLGSEERSKQRLVRGMRGKNEQGKIIGKDGKEVVAKDFNDPFFASGTVKKLKKRDPKTGKIKNVKESGKQEEKKKKRKKKGSDDEDEDEAEYDSEDSHGGFGNEEATSKAELELLMADADGGKLQGFDFRTIVEGEKLLGKKSKLRGNKKRKKQAAMEVAKSDTFKLDTKDKRFEALYEDSSFQVDKTNPQYVETRTMRTIQSERAKRRMDAEEAEGDGKTTETVKNNDNDKKKKKQQASGADIPKPKSGAASLSALVDSIKRKSRK